MVGARRLASTPRPTSFAADVAHLVVLRLLHAGGEREQEHQRGAWSELGQELGIRAGATARYGA